MGHWQKWILSNPKSEFFLKVDAKEFERRNQVCFYPCVNAMERLSYWRSRMEVSSCTFRFGAIILSNLRILLLLCVLPCSSINTCICANKKGNIYLTSLLNGHSYKKLRWYSNSLPYMKATWPPQQIPLQISSVGAD